MPKEVGRKAERQQRGPKVEEITGKMSKHLGTGTVVVHPAYEVDDLMRKIPLSDKNSSQSTTLARRLPGNTTPQSAVL